MDGDQGMLGLFDGDSSNFLDELTGTPAPAGGLGVGVGMDTGGMMDPGLGNLGGYGQMGQMEAPKLHHYDQFDQYGNPQKLHHMADATGGPPPGMQMGNQNAAGMMSPSHQQQQFGSPPAGTGHMQSPQGSFGTPYGMHNSPRMASPHHQQPGPQSMGMGGQGQMWNQETNAYMQPQGQTPPRPPSFNNSGNYMPHHDYTMPSNQPGLSHFPTTGQPNSQQPNSFGGPPQLGSPPPAQRLSHVPRSAVNNMGPMGGQGQMPMHGGGPGYAGQQGVMNQGMGGFGQQHHAGFPNDPMQQQQPSMPNAPQMGNSNMQGYPGYPNQPSQQAAMMGQQAMPDQAPPLSHFPQGATQNPQYRQPFPGIAQQRPTSSSRPTPPPQSLTPTGGPPMVGARNNTSQGNFASSSLQQLEQLVPSSMGSAGNYMPQQQRQQNIYSNASMGQQQMLTSSGPNSYGNANMMTNGGNPQATMNSNGPMVNTSLGHMGSGGPGMGQMSPVVGGGGVMPGAMSNQHNVNMEIQTLQQQIQQLYAMQQTPQTQQKMLDLQERMRTLKAQQQQQMMQHQRKQVQMQQQQGMPGARPPGPATMGPVQQQTQQLVPPAQPSPRPQLSPMQQSSPQVPPSTSQPSSMPMMVPQQQQQQMMQAQSQQQQRLPTSQPMAPTSQQLGSTSQPMGPTSQPMGPTSQQMGPTPQQMGPTPQQMTSQQMGMGPQPMGGPASQAAALMPNNSNAMSTVPSMDYNSMSPSPAGLPPPHPNQQPLMSQTGMGGPGGGAMMGVVGQPVPPQMGQGGPQMVGLGPANPPAGSAAQALGQMAQASNMNNMQMGGGVGMGMPPTGPPPTGPDGTPLPPVDESKMSKAQQAQEKANRIVAEAIAKAQAAGNPVPGSGGEGEGGEIKVDPAADGTPTTTPAKGKKPRAPRPKKEKKPKEPKTPKEPKEPKEKKEKKKKEPKEPKPKTPKKPKEPKEPKEVKTPKEGEEGLDNGEPGAEPKPKETKKKTPKPKPKPPPKKKKTLPTFLNKSKKKRKRVNSSDVSDLDLTPPGSPKSFAVEDDPNARRSGRNTKRKKYHDDLDLNLSEEDGAGEDGQAVQKPVQFFVENPADEDAQIVEKLLGMRTGKRPKPKEEKEEMEVDVDVDIEGDGEKKEVTDNGETAPTVTPAEATPAETKPAEGAPTDEKPTEGPPAEGSTTEGTAAEGVKVEGAPTEAKPVEEKKKKEEEVEMEEVEEFFVKYKNYSYLHCDWKTEEELLLGDKRVSMKIKRYRMKRLQMNSYFQLDDDDLFNPDYVEVDRVLDVSVIIDPTNSEEVTHYLVKWRGLPYEDSTWELATDVDKGKIEAFLKFRDLPAEEDREYKERPKPAEWEQREETRIYKNNNKLREYQLEGVNWLTFCWYNKQNCILADEMGLGKTVQSITFLQEAVDFGIRGPFLIIVPLSTVGNWQREFETWTDINVVVYHGSNASRNMLREYELFYKDEKGQRVQDFHRFQALITTFEVIISDVELLTQIDWRISIIDEAHRLKNRNCRLLEGLRAFTLEHRVLLTGTPLQNNTDELFSLLNFLEPKQFASAEAFGLEFGKLETDTQVDKLKAVLKPMMLRRLKEDVEKNLAPKEETIIEVELTNIQKKYYRAILERNFSFLTKTATGSNLPNLMNTMMELRKCCNHPYLVNGAEEQILEDSRRARKGAPLDVEALLMAMVQSSGKLVLIDKLLPKLKAGNHKVLIFSQMIRVLDILEDYLIQKRYLYERLDGRIRGNLRQEAIDRFSKPGSDRFAFLLCTRAGGLGINLTAADTVIIYDSDWNPQNDLQAQARCHRIGQEKAVKIYRLITRNSYEREMFDRASMKLGLDKAVLQSMRAEDKNDKPQLTKKEIEDLLKKGAYGAVMEDDKAGDEFCEEDIDQILQRRTQVITIEAEEKGSTFAKASFSMSSNRNDIDIDDPNFWQKWAKKADIDVDEIANRNQLVIEMPRVRKQTARYGNQDQILDMSELETSDSEADDELPGGAGGPGGGATPTGRGGRGRGRGRGSRGGAGSGRRGRRNRFDDDFTGLEEGGSRYSRSEFFKVEKNLLVYGWGRWDDILYHSRFKRALQTSDVDTMARAMLLYSLKHYKGDERIKGFIWDLVTAQGGEERDYSNHSGLSAPVPRGRKGKKAKEKSTKLQTALEEDMAKANVEDPEILITDNGYKKHLQRHANKVLLRVRLLYYLKYEIISTEAAKILAGYPLTEIDIPPPLTDGDPPVYWWDEDSDRSLLIGVFKHGYEKYNLMRQDPTLIFLHRCGPPDMRALAAEQNDEDGDLNKVLGEDDPEFKPEDDEDGGTTAATPKPQQPPPDQTAENGKMPFPSASDLNTRLRRVITGYQRNHKREQLKQVQYAKRLERKERFDLAIREREKMKRDSQQRWSRREEADFYRIVSTFGVERDRYSKRFKWETFRSLARLDKKYDDTLTEYFIAFYHMCKRVCKRFKTDEEAMPPTHLYIEPITEERANRCLARIELLNRLREDILWHPRLDDRLRLCQAQPEMPEWWEPGVHDKELLIGACKHGLARTDYHILHDPKLVFRDILRTRSAQYKLATGASPHPATTTSSSTAGSPRPTQPTPDLSGSQPENLSTSVIKEEAKAEPSASEKPGSVKEEPSQPVDEATLDLSVKKEEPGQEPKKESEVKSETPTDKSEEAMEVDAEVSKPEVKPEVKEEAEVKEGEAPKLDKVEEEKEQKTKGDEEEEKEEKEAKPPGSVEKMEVEGEDVKTPKTEAVSEENSAEVKEEKEPLAEVKSEVKAETAEVKPEEGEKVEAKPVVLTPASTPKKETGDQEDGTDGEVSSITNYGSPAAAFLRREQLKQAEDTPEGSGLEDGYDEYEPSPAEVLARSMNNPSVIQWPKDKVIFHRLEAVTHAVEKGEWPPTRRYYPGVHDIMSDSQSSTPLGGTPAGGTPSGTPRGEPSGHENYNLLTSSDGMGEGLKLTFQKRRKPGRRSKAEIEAERMAQMREILAGNCSSMSEGDSQSDIPLPSSYPSPSMMNGTPGGPSAHTTPTKAMDYSPMRASDSSYLSSAEKSILEGQFPGRKRRGRKRKIDKLLEAAALAQHQARVAQATAHTEEAQARAAAMAAAAQEAREAAMREAAIREAMAKRTKPPSSQDPDERVTVVNLDDGSILRGEEAPRRRDLDRWLEEHPGYMVDRADPEEEVEAALEMSLGEKKKKRRPRSDPNKLDLNNLSGYENVSVINRDTGKKITGAKAPPLKYLNEWLIQNCNYDVDGKWAGVVAAYGKLNEKLKHRILPPTEGTGRGRGRGRPPMSSPMLPGEFPYPVTSMAGLPGMTSANMMAAAAAAGFPKMAAMSMPFGGLPGLGLANPMYNLASFGMMGAGATKEDKKDGEEGGSSEKAKAGSKDSDNDSDDGTSSSSAKPHPSFPFMYNPMMFNPLFAQSSLGNFSLPMGLPTSFASLAQHAQAQQQMLNGLKDSDDEDSAPPTKAPKPSSSASTAKSESADMVAEDLSVKRKPNPALAETQSRLAAAVAQARARASAAAADGQSSSGRSDQATNLVMKDKHKDRHKRPRLEEGGSDRLRHRDAPQGESVNLSAKPSASHAHSTSSSGHREGGSGSKQMDKEGLVKELVSRVKEKKKSKLDSIISGIFAKVGDKKEDKPTKSSKSSMDDALAENSEAAEAAPAEVSAGVTVPDKTELETTPKATEPSSPPATESKTPEES